MKLTETLTAHGWLPTYHVRGCELWAWDHMATRPHLVRVYADQPAAVDALLAEDQDIILPASAM